MSNLEPYPLDGKPSSPFGTPVPRIGAAIPTPGQPGWTVVDDEGTEIQTIQEYLAHVYVATAASTDATVKTTAYALLRLWRFLQVAGADLLDCTPQQYGRFELWMRGDRSRPAKRLGGRPAGPLFGHYSTRTIKLTDAICHGFYEWLEYRRIGPLVNPVPPRGRGAPQRRNPLDPLPVRRRDSIRNRGPLMDTTPLEDSEVTEVLAAIRSPRDRCWYELGLGPGARANEVLTLTLDRVDTAHREAHVIAKGMGGATRPIPLTASFLEALGEYQAACHSRGLTLRPDGPLWWTYDSCVAPADYRTLEKAVRRISERSSVRHHFHQLRHTAATRLMRSGHLTMEQIAYVLGHRSIATTKLYTHVDQDEAWAAFLRSSTETPRTPEADFSVKYDQASLQAVFGGALVMEADNG